MSVRVMLVDDHEMMRAGLKALMQGDPGLVVAAEADEGSAAIRTALEVKPDVVVMDIAMPGPNGIEITRRIRALLPSLRVVALSMYADRLLVTEMLRAGAQGFVLKHCAFDELICAVRAVMGGEMYLSSGVIRTLVKDSLHVSPGSALSRHGLTGRELEVLKLLVEGRSTKEIAATLGVSIKTVETHRTKVRDKLGIDNLAVLTKFAIREGITSAEG